VEKQLDKAAGASNAAIEWSLGPNAPSDHSSPSAHGTLTCCIPVESCSLPPLISADILAVQTIEELVVPGEPDHIADTANQFMEHMREMQVSQPEEIQDQVSGVSYAAINSASSISQHFHFGARQSTEVILDSLNLEQNSMLVN
jgi:hypothetical protein